MSASKLQWPIPSGQNPLLSPPNQRPVPGVPTIPVVAQTSLHGKYSRANQPGAVLASNSQSELLLYIIMIDEIRDEIAKVVKEMQRIRGGE